MCLLSLSTGISLMFYPKITLFTKILQMKKIEILYDTKVCMLSIIPLIWDHDWLTWMINLRDRFNSAKWRWHCWWWTDMEPF